MYLFSLHTRSSPVLAKLQQVNAITSEECKGLNDANDVVRTQSVKSEKVMMITADHLMTFGFKKQSKFLSGNRSDFVKHVCDIVTLKYYVMVSSLLNVAGDKCYQECLLLEVHMFVCAISACK